VDNIDPRTLSRILRIEGLIPFTLCAILLGFAVTIRESGFSGADWTLFVIAGVAALLLHIDGHIWNDIMDLEIDRHEKSKETGRDRPLVFGWATVDEYRKMSVVIVILVIVLAAYLTTQRIFTPILIILGFCFAYGYNHPRLALAHHPFTEWYLFPWLVVGVTVTVVYAATGIISLLAFILSLLHGLMATCFVVSMMRRDARSDRLGGKCTTSVLYPELPHSTIYGIVTLLAAVIMLFPLAGILGRTDLAYLLVLTIAILAGITTGIGSGIDQLSTRFLYSPFPDFERKANKLMVQQAGISVVHAVAVSIIVLLSGGMV
jgi:4-hydroxybenzoate polyprenyltransferase